MIAIPFSAFHFRITCPVRISGTTFKKMDRLEQLTYFNRNPMPGMADKPEHRQAGIGIQWRIRP